MSRDEVMRHCTFLATRNVQWRIIDRSTIRNLKRGIEQTRKWTIYICYLMTLMYSKMCSTLCILKFQIFGLKGGAKILSGKIQIHERCHVASGCLIYVATLLYISLKIERHSILKIRVGGSHRLVKPRI